MNIPTTKIEIIGPRERSEEMMDTLQLMGVMQVAESYDPEKEESYQKLEEEKAKVEFARSFLRRYLPKKGFLQAMRGDTSRAFSVKEVESMAGSGETYSLVNECSRIEERQNMLYKEEKECREKISVLEKFAGIPVTTENKSSLRNFTVFLGSLREDKLEKMLFELRGETFSIFYGRGDGVFAIIYLKSKEEIFSKTRKKYEVKEEQVFWDNLPEIELKKTETRLKEIEREILEQEEKARELAENLPKLEALIDFYSWEMEKRYFLSSTEKTKRFFRIIGWIDRMEIPYVKQALGEITDVLFLREITPEKGEQPPVIVRNSGIMQSFHLVSKICGSPKPDEPDPTPFLAPFFILAFALALSDVGYGAMLIFLALLMKRAMPKMKAFFNIFLVGGVFTLLIGLFMGTVFGTDINASLRLFDPVTSPMSLLILLFVFGAVQIFCGLIIGAWWNMKLGNRNVALGKKGGSMALFLGLALYFLLENEIFLYLGIGGLVALNTVFSSVKNPFLRIAGGAGSLYDIVGYFSDILSYSRLLALGLATGIIAMVVNVVAGIAMEMIPVAGLGFFVAGIVLIIGHLFNLTVSTLGSFIHSARLQFVEFFSKFMEGGGTVLKPFSKQGRFVEVIR